MSGLTKKIIYTDKMLSVILGVTEGSLVSYAELSKGLHKYIKEKDLKNPHPVLPQTQPATPTSTPPPLAGSQLEGRGICRDCGETLPEGAVFCDTCGVRQ
jgi:ribosomal protein L40E